MYEYSVCCSLCFSALYKVWTVNGYSEIYDLEISTLASCAVGHKV